MHLQLPELYFKPKLQVINDDQIKQIHMATLEVLERTGPMAVTTARRPGWPVPRNAAEVRSQLGAVQSRFESITSNLQTVSENLQASRSRILDADFAAAGGVFKTTVGLLDEFGPDRVRDTPISEQAILGAAMGAAMTGIPVIAEIMFSDFLAVCWDIVANQISARTDPLIGSGATYSGTEAGQKNPPSANRLTY